MKLDLRNQSKIDYRELADKLKQITPAQLVNHRIIAEAPNFKQTKEHGYICPWCGSGSRDNQTGGGTFDDNNMFYCYACHNDFSGGHKVSTIDIFAHANQLDATADFVQVCNLMADEFGEEAQRVNIEAKPDKPKKSDRDPEFKTEYLKLIAADIENAHAHRHEMPTEAKRGLIDETLDHFNFGYLKRWVLTKCRAEFNYGIYVDENGKTKFLPPASERIIIPTSNEHFNAVATPKERRYTEKRYWKQHAGEIELFNATVLDDKPKYIIGVEGEFDCASIWQATSGKAPVVGIIGGNNRYLLEALDKRQITDIKVILIFDNDNGQQNAQNTVAALQKRGIAVVNALFDDFMSDDEKAVFTDKIDANAILEKLGDETLCRLVKQIVHSAAEIFKPTQKPTDPVEKPKISHAHDDTDTKLKGWQDFNGKIPPDFVTKIHYAINLLQGVTTDTVNPADVQSSKYKFAAAICRFYDFNDIADNFFLTLETAKTQAAEQIKAAKKAGGDFVAQPDTNQRAVAALNIREIKSQVNTYITDLKRNHRKYQETLKIAAQHQRTNSVPDDKYKLTEEEVEYLFSLGNTDADHAARAKIIIGDRIRFMPEQETWLAFDEKHGLWYRGTKKSTSILMPAAAHIARVLNENAPNPADYPDSVKTIDDWKSTKRTSLAFSYLKSEESIIIKREDLDNHKNLVNCKNGVIDLQTGKFYPNRVENAKFLITKQLNAIYRKGVYSDFVLNFFKSLIRDEFTRKALLNYLGYCLTGETNQHKAHFWKGGGSNGKSTLLNLLLYFFATYGAKIVKDAFVDNGKPFDANAATAALNPIGGARFAGINEFKKKDIFRADLFKDLTGDDYIYLRPLNQEGYQTIPTAKLVFNSNFPPKLDNINDDGLKRRILVVEFKEVFSEEFGNIDRQLPEKLRTDEALTGLLSLLVDEALEFYKTNRLIESREMSAARKNYIDENDFITEFIEEYCLLGEGKFVSGKDLINAIRDKYKVRSMSFKDKELRQMIQKARPSVTYGLNGRVMSFMGIALLDGVNLGPADNNRSADDIFPPEPPNLEEPPF